VTTLLPQALGEDNGYLTEDGPLTPAMAAVLQKRKAAEGTPKTGGKRTRS
jgi:hypothetical protein